MKDEDFITDDDMERHALIMARLYSDIQSVTKKFKQIQNTKDPLFAKAGQTGKSALRSFDCVQKMLWDKAVLLNPEGFEKQGTMLIGMEVAPEKTLAKLLNNYIAGVAASHKLPLPPDNCYFDLDDLPEARRSKRGPRF